MKIINDREIDLTIDMKFRSHDNKFVLFEVNKDDRWKERVAWLKSRPVTSESFVRKVKRLYGDRISDDFNCLVRRNSRGKWVLFENSQYQYPELVLEEWLYEEMGGEKGYPLKYCYACGKTFFSHGNMECLECKLGTHSEFMNKVESKKRMYKLTDDIRIGFRRRRR